MVCFTFDGKKLIRSRFDNGKETERTELQTKSAADVAEIRIHIDSGSITTNIQDAKKTVLANDPWKLFGRDLTDGKFAFDLADNEVWIESWRFSREKSK